MKYATIVLGILFIIREVSSQSNPCPEYFAYVLEGNTKYGVINIPGPSKGKTEIMVRIAITGGTICDKNSGGLELMKSLEDALADGEKGKDIMFRLNFPKSEQWPVITKITLNRKDVCIGLKVHSIWDRSYGKVLFNPKGATEMSIIPARPPIRPNSRPIRYDPPPPNINSRFLPAPKPNVPPKSNPPKPPLNDIIHFPSSSNPNSRPKPNSSSNSGSGDDTSWLNSLSQANMCGRNGRMHPTSLIIGGKEIETREFPWMVALYHFIGTKVKYTCAGSLVSNEYVITAAHCLVDQKRIYLELGNHNLSDSTEEYVVRYSLRLIRHPEYRDGGANNDIALILMKRVEFTSKIKPICLWRFGTKLDPFLASGTVTGWGLRENDGDFSNVPMKLEVKRVNQNTCKNSNRELARIVTEKTFCAGGQSAGPCHGDSGSGFYHFNMDIWYLRGIVSMSLGNSFVCDVEEYAVYADIAFFLNWLKPYLSS